MYFAYFVPGTESEVKKATMHLDHPVSNVHRTQRNVLLWVSARLELQLRRMDPSLNIIKGYKYQRNRMRVL